MKRVVVCLLASVATAISGELADKKRAEMEARMKEAEEITYLDRNGDGKVDREVHRYRGWADADWILEDNDFNGRYEKKTQFGAGIIYSAVDIPVPMGVKITKSGK
jgi:hypothetical protein